MPIIVYCLYLSYWITACILLLFAGFTDILDGALARYRNEETDLGAGLDPIADKILIIFSYFTLVFVKTPLPRFFLIFIIAKELIQIIGAIYLGVLHNFVLIKANIWGKVTTVVQVTFICWLCLVTSFQLFNNFTFWLFLILIVALNIITLLSYGIVGLKGLRLWQKID